LGGGRVEFANKPQPVFWTAKSNSDGLVDLTVFRARNDVSHFAPNSAISSPDVKLGEGIYICGDWIDRTDQASWSTENIGIVPRQAASSLSKDFGLQDVQCTIIPAAPDTPQLTALRQSAKLLKSVLPAKTLPPFPWDFAKQLLSGNKDP